MRFAYLALTCVSPIGCAGQSMTASAEPPPWPRPISIEESPDSDSLLWRETPVSNDAARQVVRRYFAAIASESEVELEQLLAEDAAFHRPNQTASPALLSWLRRFSSADYSRPVVTRNEPIQVLDPQACARVGEHRSLHLLPGPEELLALVRLPAATSSEVGLWGSEVQLVLTLSDDDWKVRQVWEDYASK